MSDLKTVAQQVVEEWRTDYGSVRMASLMMKLEDAISQPEIKDDKPLPPTDAQTEAEKIAYCAGWWAAMEAKRAELEELREVLRDAISTLDRSGYPISAAELRDAVAGVKFSPSAEAPSHSQTSASHAPTP